MVAVAGASQILTALLGAFVVPNQAKMSAAIRQGDLDLVLVRPVSAQWYAAFRWIQPAELGGVLSGLALVVAGFVAAGVTPSVSGLLVACLWFGLGIGLICCVWFNLGYLAFWIESVDPANALMATLLSAGRYPIAFFPSGVRIALYFVIPVGVATTMPITALADRSGGPALWLVILILAAFVGLTRLHWVVALRRYASASS